MLNFMPPGTISNQFVFATQKRPTRSEFINDDYLSRECFVTFETVPTQQLHSPATRWKNVVGICSEETRTIKIESESQVNLDLNEGTNRDG
jgi:hypothetical protein